MKLIILIASELHHPVSCSSHKHFQFIYDEKQKLKVKLCFETYFNLASMSEWHCSSLLVIGMAYDCNPSLIQAPLLSFQYLCANVFSTDTDIVGLMFTSLVVSLISTILIVFCSWINIDFLAHLDYLIGTHRWFTWLVMSPDCWLPKLDPEYSVHSGWCQLFACLSSEQTFLAYHVSCQWMSKHPRIEQ